MFGNCKIHVDVQLQLQEGERGKPILKCPKCVEELQSRFEKFFSNTKLPDVVQVRPECIQKDLIDDINPIKRTETEPVVNYMLEIFEAVRRVEGDNV